MVKSIPQGGRTKYYNSTLKTRLEIIRGVAKKDIVVIERHTELNDQMSPKKKEALYLEILKESLEAALEIDGPEDVVVLLDNPPLKIDASIQRTVEGLVKEGHRIRWFAIGISEASNHLKVQDYVTGTVADEVEGMKPKQYKKLRGKVRR